MRRVQRLLFVLLTLPVLLAIPQVGIAQVVINEIRIDEPGSDVDEYFELAGPPGNSLDGLTYLVIGDGSFGTTTFDGTIEAVIDLTGWSISPAGYFSAAEASMTLGPVDLVTDLNFENSDNVTHLLVEGFTGTLAQDLDTDDDGILDVTPWSTVLDIIALQEDDGVPPSGTEWSYGPPSIGPDGGFVPSHIRRCPDITGDFLLGSFGPIGEDSPGAANVCPSCLAPLDFACLTDCSADTVELSWTNTDAYTEINISRDGTPIATVAGSAATYSDVAPTAGEHTYLLSTVCSGTTADDVECTVTHSPYTGQSHIVFAGEQGWGIGAIDSTALVMSALEVNGHEPLLIDRFDLPCLADFAVPGNVIWVVLGTYPDKYELTVEDGQELVDLLSAGVHIYLESADMFAWDDPQPFMDYDGVDNSISLPHTIGHIPDGDDSFTSMNGGAFGVLDLSAHVAVTYNQDADPDSDHTDQLIVTGTDPATPVDLAGSAAGVVWSNNPDLLPDPAVVEEPYATGIFYDTDPGFGKVLVQSWEFGGFDGDQIALLAEYMGVFTSGPVGDLFIRGDSNSDGAMDISDAVFSLSALFTPGSPGSTCADSADANDDGTFDISDAVYTLGALFTPGSPPPSAPHPNCGEDPTVDGLDCGAFSACP